MQDNLYFIGSIWYQICLKLQDKLLHQSKNKNYELGNWKKEPVNQKYSIKPAKSLIYEGKHEKDNLISGLIPGAKIGKIFGKGFWDK